MSIPKPQPPKSVLKPIIETPKPKPKPAAKRPPVIHEHLMDRPFKGLKSVLDNK